MIDKDRTRESINRALDFKRDDEIGYMLTDFDIILGITKADYNENVTIYQAETFFNQVKRQRNIREARER